MSRRRGETAGAEGVRAFVALEIEQRKCEELLCLISTLRQQLHGIRCVSPGGLHLTLRFLGESPPDRLTRLEGHLGAAAEACPPSVARLSGLGTFPEAGAPRVLWLGVELGPAVLALQERCERAAVAAGFGPEKRPFRPHLTLGRWRNPTPRPHLPEVELGLAALPTLALLRSQLRPDGAVHTPLARFPLGGAEPSGVEASGSQT
jgi:2'-5' RNA ligase